MTADELIIELHNRQGYYLLADEKSFPIGHITDSQCIGETSSMRFRITARATFEEFNAQSNLVADILGRRRWPVPADGRSYHFYRVEATD